MFASTWELPFEPNHQFISKISHRQAIPNNLKNWQVFDSDEQINNFLALNEEFSSSFIDLKKMDLDEIIDDEGEVINLNVNHLPKGLSPLEDLLHSNDIPKKPKMEPLKADIEEYNLGT